MMLAKWQGLGNDYLIVESSSLPGELTADAIHLLCDRHFGVGSDGILAYEPPSGVVPGAIARMRIFNPDASEPEMCGNGIRMFARYLVQKGVVPADGAAEFTVETRAGAIKPCVLADGRVRVDMGHARFASDNLDQAMVQGLVNTDDDAVEVELSLDGVIYRFTFVDVGNPHCVIEVEDPDGVDIAHIGPLLEHHSAFPNRVNVEFVCAEPDGSVRMRVWERGVGETMACGTGATAVGAAMVQLGRADSPVLVHLAGGDLTIEVGPVEETGTPVPGRRVFMTGPAEEVFVCDLSTDLLHRLGWAAPTGR